MSKDRKNNDSCFNTIQYYLKSDVTKVVLVVLCLLVLAVGIMSIVKGGTAESVTLVISFFGILATFIVVSNYSQITDIKTETNRKIIQHDFQIQDQNRLLKEQIEQEMTDIESQIRGDLNSAKDDLAELTRSITTEADEPWIPILSNQLIKLEEEVKTLQKNQTENQQLQEDLAKVVAYFINGEHRSILLSVLLDQKINCCVKYKSKIYKAKASLDNNEICFEIENIGSVKDVESINGVTYNVDTITQYLEIINSIIRKKEKVTS